MHTLSLAPSLSQTDCKPAKLSDQIAVCPLVCACPMQIVALEKSGGTILGGAIKLIRDKKKNPGPPRDPSLPPKPKGQTVGSFTGGLRMLPEAIAHKMHNKLRLVPLVSLPSF